MQLSVKGKQLDVGDALRNHVQASLSGILGKYFGDAIDASVTLSRESHLYRAVVTAHVGRGIRLEAQAEASEPYPAFDQAAERLSKRLRRYKRRLRDHHKDDGAERKVLMAQQYILSGESAGEPEDETTEGNSGPNENSQGNGADEAQPMVVAEMTTEIPNLTVSEAVMRMDLAELPALMFHNQSHGGLNMVYRRSDGNIGWIDPHGNSGS